MPLGPKRRTSAPCLAWHGCAWGGRGLGGRVWANVWRVIGGDVGRNKGAPPYGRAVWALVAPLPIVEDRRVASGSGPLTLEGNSRGIYAYARTRDLPVASPGLRAHARRRGRAQHSAARNHGHAACGRVSPRMLQRAPPARKCGSACLPPGPPGKHASSVVSAPCTCSTGQSLHGTTPRHGAHVARCISMWRLHPAQPAWT